MSTRRATTNRHPNQPPSLKEALEVVGEHARARLGRDIPAVMHDNPIWAAFQLEVQERRINPVEALVFAENHSLDIHAGPRKRDLAVYMRGPRMHQPNLAGLSEDVLLGSLRDWINRPMRQNHYDDLLTILRAAVRYYQQRLA